MFKKGLIIIFLCLLTSCTKINNHNVNNSLQNNHYLLIDNIYLVNNRHPLPKDFIPNTLVKVSKIDYIEKDQGVYLDKETLKHLQMLFNEAIKYNLHFTLFSGYRSYDYQQKLYDKANDKSYVAKPGSSEHQTGVACDIGLRDVGLTKAFDNHLSLKFLQEHAKEYGFILRYPQGKEKITGYPYESWHYTYVGTFHALKISELNLTLEEYFEEVLCTK